MCRRRSANSARVITCLRVCRDPIKQDGRDFNRKTKGARTPSSESRVPAFQAGCRGFEPRLPLQALNRLFTGSLQAASWQASGERVSKQAVLCCVNMQVSLILSRQGSLSKRRTAKPHPLTPSLAPLLLLLPSTQRKQDRSPLNRLQRRQRAYQQRRAMSPPRAPPCPVVGSLRRL